MKASYILLVGLFLSLNSFATVDGVSDVAIVADKSGGEGLEFEMRKVPMWSCVGIHEEAINGLWTQPVNVTASIGCGGPVVTQNINQGSCVVSNLVWDENYIQLQKIVLHTAHCSPIWGNDWMSTQEQKDVRDGYIDALKKAARFNFGNDVPIEVL